MVCRRCVIDIVNKFLALSINQYQIIKKMCLNLNSLCFNLLFFLTSASFIFGQTDFLSSLVYDATKTYEEGDSVIPSVDLSDQIYTARKSVPLDTPPLDSSGEISNTDYWATSGDYTTELATQNSAALSDVPDDAIVDTQQVENLGTPSEDTGDDNETVPSGLTTATNKAFVMQQYRDFFGRDADESGLSWWTEEIDAGRKERADLAMDFVYSTEFQNNVAPVVRLYFAYFNRLPDTGGLTFWIDSFINPDNWTLFQISDFFAASDEFIATYGSLDNGPYVTLTYNNVFEREPDSGGYNFWKNELDTGNRTRGMAMVEHAESQEYKDKMSSEVHIVAYYFSLLRRAPDQGGFDYWVARLKDGDSAKGLIADFLYSEEYQGRDFTLTH